MTFHPVKPIVPSDLTTPDWQNVVDWGADPTGASDSSPAFKDAVNALLATSGGGIAYVPAGTYKLDSTVTAELAPTQSVQFFGDGFQASIVKSYVTGDAFRMYASSYSGTNYAQGSGFRNLTVDGSNAGNSSNGIHVGDINALRLDVMVQNFSGTSSIGLLLENTVNWTEEADVRALLVNNTTAVEFNQNGGTNSFGYGAWDFTIWPHSTPGQNAVIVNNGASLYHGSLRVRGNFLSSSSTLSNYVLQVINDSDITGVHLDIQVETPSGTNHATTINVDGTSAITGCYGTLDFSQGGGQFAESNLSVGQLQFTGTISGDPSIVTGAAYDVWVFGSVNAPQILVSDGYHGGGFPTTTGDMFTTTLSANLSANLHSSFYNGNKTLGVPQRVTIVIQQAASGGPYTVTWEHNASPSTSACRVEWAGGSAPTMSTGANAVDVYNLQTMDGATWYGQAIQNVS